MNKLVNFRCNKLLSLSTSSPVLSAPNTKIQIQRTRRHTMCEKCVKEEFPERDTMCADQGAYMMNLLHCVNCGGKNIKSMNRVCSETDLEEDVKYDHTCADCQHVCAEHEYKFRVVDDYQHYEMSCLLCGSGEDQRSILPVDPRGPHQLF